MGNISVELNRYMPKISTFYSLFEMLKSHEYIQDVDVVQRNGQPFLRVFRKTE